MTDRQPPAKHLTWRSRQRVCPLAVTAGRPGTRARGHCRGRSLPPISTPFAGTQMQS